MENDKSKTYSKGVKYLFENVFFSAYKLHYKTTLLFFFGCKVFNIQSAQIKIQCATITFLVSALDI